MVNLSANFAPDPSAADHMAKILYDVAKCHFGNKHYGQAKTLLEKIDLEGLSPSLREKIRDLKVELELAENFSLMHAERSSWPK